MQSWRDLSTFGGAFGLALAASVLWYLWGHRRVLARGAGGRRVLDLSGFFLICAVDMGLNVFGRRTLEAPLLFWAGMAVLFVGLYTDGSRLPRGLRALAVIAAGIFLCYHAICINTLKLPFGASFISLGYAGPVVTILWLILCSGLFARVGTLPSVPLGVGALAGLTMYLICLMQPQATGPLARALSLAIFGACLPMVPFARKLTLGGATAGSYTLGFLVGCLTMVGALKNTAALVILLPLLLIGIPLFATTLTYATDLRRKVRARVEHHRHLHEALLTQGYSYWQVVTIELLGTAYLCGLALLLVRLIEVSFLLKLLAVGVVLIGGAAFFYLVLRLLPRRIEPGTAPQQVRLLGIKLSPFTMPQALEEAERYMREDRPHMIVTADASGLIRARRDAELCEIMNQAAMVTADGAGVVLAAKLLNLPVQARCSGCDMVVELCALAERLERSVYLLGAEPGVAEEAAAKLRERVPELQVAGVHDGYFTPEEEPAIVAEIAAAHPAALFVALGIPRQEKWIRAHLEELNVPVCVGVGGSFDVISGRKQRAPVWMQRTGLEWLYRTVKEPRRIGRLAALPQIVWLAFVELLRGAPDESAAPPPSPKE